MEQVRTAFRNARTREVASHYPNWKGRNGLSYEIASQIDKYNQSWGRTVPIEEIKQLGNPRNGNKRIPANPPVSKDNPTRESFRKTRESQQNRKSQGGGQLLPGL